MFVVNFHGIGAPKRPVDADEAEYWIDVAQYEAALDTIVAHPRGRDVIVTFDDSNRSDIEIALDPLLRRGLKAKFFLLAGMIGQPGYLTPDDLRKLHDAGMEIGTHGVAHVRWDLLDDPGLSREIDRSLSDIEKWTGVRVTSVGLPFGGYNLSVLRALNQRGLKEVYSSDGGPRLSSLMPIPRYSVVRSLTPALLRRKIDQGFSLPGRVFTEMRSVVKSFRSGPHSPPRPIHDGARPQMQVVEASSTQIFCDGALVLIVGFRNAVDVTNCLSALTKFPREPGFDVLICENGGAAAFRELVRSLTAPDGPCAKAGVAPLTSDERIRICAPESKIVEAVRLRLGDVGPHVLVGRASENLGYAAAINAWLRTALSETKWTGAWILNPDTQPQPDALLQLATYAHQSQKGMVGSRIMTMDEPDFVCSRGLKWRKFMASTLGVGANEPTLPAPDPAIVEAKIDAPSGASFYVTRACIEKIGTMDESYFLYFEDVEWGLRAKKHFGIGYAYDSVVPHIGGSTIGSSPDRRLRSKIAVYYEFRNRILFVRRNHPSWFVWTALVTLLHCFEFLAVGATGNFWTGLRAVWAGITGETGRADAIFPQLSVKD